MNVLISLILPIVYVRHVLASQDTPSSSNCDHSTTCPSHSRIPFSAPWGDPTVDPNWPYPTHEAFEKARGPLYLAVERTYIGLSREDATKKYEKENKDLREIQLVRVAKCHPDGAKKYLKWEEEVLPEIMKRKIENMLACLQDVQRKEAEKGEAEKDSPAITVDFNTHPSSPSGDSPETEKSAPSLLPNDLFPINFLELTNEDVTALQSLVKDICGISKEQSTSAIISPKSKNASRIIDGGIEITNEIGSGSEDTVD